MDRSNDAMVRSSIAFVVSVVLLAVAVAAQQAPVTARVIEPASYRSGPMPELPVMAVGGGEVVVELTISDRGVVTAVRPLRGTVPYTDLVVDVVRTWQFVPAAELFGPATGKPGESAKRSIESKMTVAALFRPPSVYANATLGEAVRDTQNASDEVPFPMSTVMPTLHPSARSSGVVMTEARVDRSGAVTEVNVKHSSPPFDDAALEAARAWRFRPARVAGSPVASRVYLIFSFQLPVSLSAPAAPSGPQRQ
jgi:protein TonB